MNINRHSALKCVGLLLAIAAFAVALGFAVSILWNALLPPLFDVPRITFWQALGLLVLSRLLFGSFRGLGHHDHRGRERMRERWENMSEEERATFKRGLHKGCRWRAHTGDQGSVTPNAGEQG